MLNKQLDELKEKGRIASFYEEQTGRIGYLVLWLLGAPFSLLFVLWILFGNNLIGKG